MPVLMFICLPGLFASELEDRQMIRDKVHTLFFSKNYFELDRMAGRYLATGERTSSGLWMLTLFYSAIGSVPNTSVTTESYWDGLESSAKSWINAYPDSPTGYLTYANFLLRHAWMYRGNGWANQVRKEDWKPFREYIENTRIALEESKSIASRDPQWYVLMIDVATAQGWETSRFHLLVDEAIQKYPYFYQIYFEAINYLTPKWNGSKEEIERFANKVVAITSEKEKNGMYARIYWVASQASCGCELFTKSAVIWKKMSRAIDDVVAQYPDQWNINNFAYFACLAGDVTKTRKLIDMIEGKPIVAAWKQLDFFMQCRSWAEHESGYNDRRKRAGGVVF